MKYSVLKFVLSGKDGINKSCSFILPLKHMMCSFMDIFAERRVLKPPKPTQT